MHHLPRIFDLRKKSKKMDQTPSPRPRLQRRNAVKNFDYNPSASSSTSPSSMGGSSSAHRTRSLDLPVGLDKTSFRIDSSSGEIDSILQNWGLSTEDLEIPKAAYETMIRSSSDVIPRPKRGHFDFKEDDAEESKEEEVNKFNDTLDNRHWNDDQINENDVKIDKIADLSLKDGYARPVEKITGIKGDRPPLLAPPPAMSLPILDNGCSTWDILKSLAPDDDGSHRFSDCNVSPNFDDDEGDGASREGVDGVRIGETEILSGSCSFTTTNDDDSSSTTTEAVSIISPVDGCKMSITHWEKGGLLGRGSFGTVYEGISSEGFFFAVKEVSLVEQGRAAKQSIYQLEQEIELLSQFEHENIVRYLGTDKRDSFLYIFLELVTQGSLASLYQKYSLRDSHASAYTRQILMGLKYLHDRSVVHRDIKCANILVASTGIVKLADFGLAKATRFNDLMSCKGTVFWMAPEVVNNRNQGYGPAADIWSLGCTVLEMLTGHVPYYPLEFTHALFRIGERKPPEIPEGLSMDARDFIQQCIRVDPNDRPTAAELLDHRFVRRSLSASSGSESPMLRGGSL